MVVNSSAVVLNRSFCFFRNFIRFCKQLFQRHVMQFLVGFDCRIQFFYIGGKMFIVMKSESFSINHRLQGIIIVWKRFEGKWVCFIHIIVYLLFSFYFTWEYKIIFKKT